MEDMNAELDEDEFNYIDDIIDNKIKEKLSIYGLR